MESLLPFFRMHWDHEPDWHPSPCPLPAKRGEGGRRPGEGRFMERFPRKISRIEPLNLVGTARCAVRAAFSGATMPPAASRAGTSQRDVPTKVSVQRAGVRASVVSHRRAPPKHGFALAEGLVRSRLFAGHRLETGGGE